MNELSKADTLRVLKDIKCNFENEYKPACNRFSLFSSREDALLCNILSTYVAAMETAIECVEKNLED